MKRRARAPREVFLSHASADRRFATKLAVVLKAHDIPVWYSRISIRGAKQWHDEIGRALKRCDWFILVLSPSAVRSMWVKRELMFVLRASRYKDRIVPITIKPCNPANLSWVLPTFQLVDFSREFGLGCRELLEIWAIGYDAHRGPAVRRPRRARRRRPRGAES